MNRLLRTSFLLLLITGTLFGQTAPDQQPLAQGIVSAVDRTLNLVYIAGGQIAIDVTGARIYDINGDTNLDAVRPGQHIATVIHPGNYAGRPLHARVLQILTQPIGSITGVIEAIDVPAKRFTVLGRRIAVNDRTIFVGGVPAHDPQDITELQVGQTVNVSLDGSHTDLVAQRIYVIPPRPDRMVAFQATVLSIQGDTWTTDNREFPTFRTTSGTSIQGMVGVGSVVMVTARVDGGQLTAVSIAPFSPPRPRPSNPFSSLTGILTSRTADMITINNGPAAFEIVVLPETRFVDDPKVGDNVRVEIDRRDGRFVAISVYKMTGSMTFLIIDTVTSIGATEWKVGAYTVMITPSTNIVGSPKVGDRVRVLGERQSDGVIVARMIDKP